MAINYSRGTLTAGIFNKRTMTCTIPEILEKIKRIRLTVVGDIMLDHYIWGDAWRISPEAPVPVVAVDKDSYAAGGSANVALNLRAMGAQVNLCGIFGQDEAGGRLAEILEQHGVQYDERFRRPEIPTILKTRVVVRNQQLCRLDREAPPSLYEVDSRATADALELSLTQADGVILSDYAKGSLNEKLIKTTCDTIHECGGIVSLDPKPSHKLAFRDLDLITPNRSESLMLAGITINQHEIFPGELVCKNIWQAHAPRNLVITLGAEGMLLCPQGKVCKQLPTLAREVFDVSGAGDTVIAALTAALAAGVDLESAAHFANVAAGVVVAKIGTATATPDEILTHEAEGDW